MKLSDLGEKKIIKKLAGYLDIGDDTAYIKFKDTYLILTTDMIYQDTHILPHMSWEQIGALVVSVNLSDIASMGAEPIAFLLAYGSPDTDYENFKSLIHGVKTQCDKYHTKYAGGDTNKTEKITLAGFMLGESEKPVLRSGAKIGDLIAVTGTLGSASIGTKILLNTPASNKPPDNPAYNKALQPQPRMKEGLILKEYVNSMTDISDGLATSLTDLTEERGFGAEIILDKLPLDADAITLAQENRLNHIEHALYGEGDYELLFTLSEEKLDDVLAALPITVIGSIKANQKITFIDSQKNKHKIKKCGYEHFKT
ncbi:MAG: thiamine-phosphate kinase [Candidatus Altiarchaeales archaeon ex4484_96]|nr:MAG: thiamine-phosphate kinase [Candidatus Altiarchaeales archaeon ex4484_96]